MKLRLTLYAVISAPYTCCVSFFHCRRFLIRLLHLLCSSVQVNLEEILKQDKPVLNSYIVLSTTNKTKCTKHIVDTQHAYRTIEDTMDIVKKMPKGYFTNTREIYYVCEYNRKRQ